MLAPDEAAAKHFGFPPPAKSIRVELAGVPTAKGRPRFSRALGIAYTPSKTRRYESALRLAAQDSMEGRPPITGPVRVEIEARFPIPKSWSKKKTALALQGVIRHTSRPDFENFAKTVDAFNEVVWKDDSQVCEATIRKIYSERPALVIVVTPL